MLCGGWLFAPRRAVCPFWGTEFRGDILGVGLGESGSPCVLLTGPTLMTTGGGGLDPPQEGTRPPDEERARPTVEEKDDHAADERAGSGGSPGGSPDAPRDGGSGQELPDVSRGKAPSTTITVRESVLSRSRVLNMKCERQEVTPYSTNQDNTTFTTFAK